MQSMPRNTKKPILIRSVGAKNRVNTLMPAPRNTPIVAITVVIKRVSRVIAAMIRAQSDAVNIFSSCRVSGGVQVQLSFGGGS